MRQILISFLFLSLFTFTLTAQSGSSLEEKQQLLVQAVGKVEDSKSTYTQQWSFDGQIPYLVKLTVIETDKKKGKTETTVYRFNLADLDENLVREDTRRDLKFVTAAVGGKQNMVEVFEDGEQQNYVDEITILVNDSNEADEIREKLRSIIPDAKALDKERLQVNGYDQMVSWLRTNITDFTLGENAYRITFQPQAADELVYDYSVTNTDSKGSSTTVYSFNLADLDPYSVRLNVRGKSIQVEVDTERKQRFVTVMEDGSMQNYDDEVNFVLGDVEHARDLAEVLRLTIPEGKERRSKSLQPAADLASGLEAFKELLIDFEQEGEKFRYQFEENCYTTFRQEEIDSKGGTTEYSYELHLGDLVANNVEIKVAGKDIFVIGGIKDGDNFIKNFRDGEQRNYTDEVEFRAQGVEHAKSLAYLLQQIAEGCEQQQQNMLTAARKGLVNDQIVEQVEGFKDVTEPEYEQHLAINEQDCSIVFSTIEPKGKGVEKMRYEVFLKELNPEALRPHVSGKVMEVELKTIHNQDHIKSYKDDEVEKYTDSFSIRVPGITEARQLIVGLQQLLDGCKE